MQTVYEAAGGDEGLLRLASAWHARVMADEVVSHAFSHGFHPEHHERLAAYWAEALGGPEDRGTWYATAAAWLAEGTGAERTELPGGHVAYDSHPKEFMEGIRRIIG